MEVEVPRNTIAQGERQTPGELLFAVLQQLSGQPLFLLAPSMSHFCGEASLCVEGKGLLSHGNVGGGWTGAGEKVNTS